MAYWLASGASYLAGPVYNWAVDSCVQKQDMEALKAKIHAYNERTKEIPERFDFMLMEIEEMGLTWDQFNLYMLYLIEKRRKRRTREDRITGWELAHRRWIQATTALSPDNLLDVAKNARGINVSETVSSYLVSPVYNWAVDSIYGKPTFEEIKAKVEKSLEEKNEPVAKFESFIDGAEAMDITWDEFNLFIVDRLEQIRRRRTREDRITGWELAHRRLIYARDTLTPSGFADWAASNAQLVRDFVGDALVPTAVQNAVKTLSKFYWPAE